MISAWLRVSTLLIMALFAGSAPAGAAKLGFLRDGWLQTLTVDGAGVPLRGASPRRVCRLWMPDDYESLALLWRPGRHQIVVQHCIEQGGRYGLPSNDGSYCGLWIVEDVPGARPRKIAGGCGPTFSPTGG